MQVYEPREDTFLAERFVRKFATGKVLDMGTGSGYLANVAAQLKSVTSVLAADINPAALKKVQGQHSKIAVRKSNLLSNIAANEHFNTIIFNPPYLPDDGFPHDPALIGGMEGYETTISFLVSAVNHLKPDAVIILIVSSLSQPAKIQEKVEALLLRISARDEVQVGHEILTVWKLEKTPLLESLHKMGVRNITYAAKGKRGHVYRASWEGKNVAIKVKNPSSLAVGRIENEVKVLKRLKSSSIEPRLIRSTREYFIREWADGLPILEFIEKNKKSAIKNMLIELFMVCHELDKLNIVKEEMHHPWKHVIVGKKVYLIDFERAHGVRGTHKNGTQFLQMLRALRSVLMNRGIEISPTQCSIQAKKYAKDLSSIQVVNFLKKT